ncbi:LysR substrate-binding domain-containing protein [Luteibacter sp.]|uniref:LysR substrate-binding domain-containing protein n=1 Tax=Luteibacter sp. TaxID=1886636 RepID=UPI003F81A201
MADSDALGDMSLRELQARLPGLLVFQSVAQHLNFARAADDLRVTPTAVSKAIKQLEAQMGIRLFNRNTRSTSLTEAGQRLYSNLRPALKQVSYSLESAASDTEHPSGLLRINTSFVAYATLIEPHLADFLASHPDIRFELSLDSTLVDIVESGFDAGIRLGHALQRDMIAAPLGPPQAMVAVASPDYTAANGRPSHPRDLLAHRCIRQRFSSHTRFFEWTFHVDGKPVVIDVDGPMVVDEMRVATTAAVNGIGIAYVFRRFVDSHIATGALEVVLERYSQPRVSFHVYYPSTRQMPGKLRAFIDYIRAANRQSP